MRGDAPISSAIAAADRGVHVDKDSRGDASAEQWRTIGKLAAAALGVIVVVGVAFWLIGLATG